MDQALLDEVSKLGESWGWEPRVGDRGRWTTDNLLTAIRFLPPRSHLLDLRLCFDGNEYTLSQRGIRDEFSGQSMEEALLRLLHERLSRTCPECRQLDGHDVRCTINQAEEDAE